MKKANLLQFLWFLMLICGLTAGWIAFRQIEGAQLWSFFILFTVSLLCWGYLSVRLIGFRIRLFKFFRQLLANDYNAGIRTRRRHTDEISRLEGLANHLVERLQEYDRLRAHRVSIQTRAFDLLFDRSTEPLAAIDVSTETLHFNSVAQTILGIERRSFSFESALKPDINGEFRDQFNEAILGRKVITDGFSWLQLPGMSDPVYVGLQFTPLRDKNETVCFALLAIKAPPGGQKKKKLMNPLQQFVKNLSDFLEFKRDEGFQTLDVSSETLAACKSVLAKPPNPVKSSAFKLPAADPVVHKGVCVTGKTIDQIAGQIRTCSACPLHQARSTTVPGEGNANQPDILLIGEAPGPDEDEQGRPFMGEAGALLDKMITAMGYSRGDLFITTLVRCRPPGVRTPFPEEIQVCMPYLEAQIALIRPKIIIALGKTVVETLLKKPVAISKLRGTWCSYKGIDLMPTYNPGYLLKSPGHKADSWSDLKAVLTRLGKSPPVKK